MSKNINTNTAIANIILSDNHEIRLKKKPKKKSSNKKKEILDKVKNELRNYDMAVADAKSKNITLPAELGVLPVKIEDVNSIKELEELAIKLQSMTNQINQLIAQGASKQRTSGLFSEGMGSSQMRFFPVQPRPIQPIEPQPIIRPIQPIVPSSNPIDPTQVKDDDVEQSLNKLQKEILDKLSPEDKAKAEEQIRQEQEQQKQQPVEPSDTGTIPESPSVPDQTPSLPDLRPPEKMKESDLETFVNVKFGNQTIPKLEAPTGFYNFLTDYRRYVENVEFDTVLINTGEYKIEKSKYRMLQNQKQSLLDEYDKWLSGLNRQQLQYIDNSQQLTSIINEIMLELQLDPEDLSKKILKSQNKNVTEFKVGDEETGTEIAAKERLSEEGKKLEQKLKINKDLINDILSKANNTIKEDELNELINQLNLAKVESNKYNQLSGIDQVALEVLHSEVIDSIIEASNQIENKIKEVKQGLPIDPLQEIDSDAPVLNPVPVVRLSEKEKAAKIVNDFVNGKSTYSAKVRTALGKLPDSDTVLNENELIRNRGEYKQNINKDLKKITKDYLVSNNLYIEPTSGAVDI